LNALWQQLPTADRQEVGQIVAQMIARQIQILPSRRKEGSHEPLI
jgi:hypothetical protein